MRGNITILLFLALSCTAATAQEAPKREGVTSREEAVEGRSAYSLHLPERLPKSPALLVALHEFGETDEELLGRLESLARRARYAILCPKSEGLGFLDNDVEPVLAAIREAGDRLSASSVHLLGTGDAGYRALKLGLTHPRTFRCVVSLGADVPQIRPKRGAATLRVLVLKGEKDRPAAGRASLEAIRKDVEVAEFREVPGNGVVLDSANAAYVQHFLDAASGKASAGKDMSLPWKDPARGLAERNRRKVPALIYFFDDDPAHARRTEWIQTKLFYDAKLRKAVKDAVPILAPRNQAEKLVPDARLAPGPAFAVLDTEGKLTGVAQRKVTAGALVQLIKQAARK